MGHCESGAGGQPGYGRLGEVEGKEKYIYNYNRIILCVMIPAE